MATKPSFQDCIAHLEGFGITSEVCSPDWIERQRDNFVIPFINERLGYDIETEETITEYVSGNGTDTLFLSRRGINELVSIERVYGADVSSSISLTSVVLLADKGEIKARSGTAEYWQRKLFIKGTNNIKIVYKCGGSLPTDLALAITMLTCAKMLTNIANRTGGGNLTVQGFSRDMGSMGRYTNMRKSLNADAFSILKKYMTGVTGS